MYLAGVVLICASRFALVSTAYACTDLDDDQFGQCRSIGFNQTSANSSDQTANLLRELVAELRNCSPELVNYVACSMNVPKCRGESDQKTVLPCRDVCDTFESQCRGHHGVDFVRKLCPLLPLNDTCLKPANFKANVTGEPKKVFLDFHFVLDYLIVGDAKVRGPHGCNNFFGENKPSARAWTQRSFSTRTCSNIACPVGLKWLAFASQRLRLKTRQLAQLLWAEI